MMQDTGDTSPAISAPDPANFAGTYAVEGHPNNSATVPASPPPPTIVPTSPAVQLVQTAAALAPTPVAPVAASLIGGASTPTLTTPPGTTPAGQPAAGGGSTGGVVADATIYTPATQVSAGDSGMPGPFIPNASDVGVGADFGAPLAIQSAAPTARNNSTPQSQTAPQLSPLVWVGLGLAALHLLG